MFIKITKSWDHQYVQLVQSYRENGVVKHEVEIEGETIFIKTQSTELSKKILRLMRIAPPGNITRADEFASRWQDQP
ncbi:hypothetical protein MHOCP_20010 [Moorella humiferrea]|uniref:hypothetical protein n=1 Tax=Neomoorella humiferrea TaxID=676965 RepID=UPI0030D3364A